MKKEASLKLHESSYHYPSKIKNKIKKEIVLYAYL